MNRLVIIGNGFDLAHGLPTSYKNFIDDFWKNLKFNFNEELHRKIVTVNNSYTGIFEFEEVNSFESFKNSLQKYSTNYGKKYIESSISLYEGSTMNDISIIFKIQNEFFKTICNINSENWVDIENEYYKQLKKIVRSKSANLITTDEDWIKKQKNQVKKLNDEFEDVRNLLEKYLKEKVEEQYDFKLLIDNSINSILLPELEFRFDQKEYLKEFQYGDQLYVKEFLDKSKENYDLTTHLLNFNYTTVVQKYFDGFAYPKVLNYIHGKLNDTINKVNFGFGDEMDEDYKTIENINDNEYLRNFKSFQYLQNPNYKSLLDFVESDRKFQVYILGHTCGLSDRTLLNTIFEHSNCISIKVFYHKYTDKKSDGSNDNYMEIVQNISRHFDNKKLMRSKIVNKELCSEFPQNIRLQKK